MLNYREKTSLKKKLMILVLEKALIFFPQNYNHTMQLVHFLPVGILNLIIFHLNHY